MGVVYSTAIRKIRRFNVENRAHRAIDVEKPAAAPKHPSTAKLYEKIMKDSANVKEQLRNKDVKLDKFLKDVYVSSQNKTSEIQRDTSKLPKDTRPHGDEEFGFKIPSEDEVLEGHITLKQAIQFITDHRTDPQTWTTVAIANKHKLDVNIVGDVLEYFRAYNVHLPRVVEDKGGIFSFRQMKEGSVGLLPPDEKELKMGIPFEVPPDQKEQTQEMSPKDGQKHKIGGNS